MVHIKKKNLKKKKIATISPSPVLCLPKPQLLLLLFSVWF